MFNRNAEESQFVDKVVHINRPLGAALSILICKLFTSSYLIVHVHSTIDLNSATTLIKTLQKLVITYFSDKVIVVSNYIRKMLFNDHASTETLYLGVDKYACVKTQKQNPIVVFVGMFNDTKNPLMLIEAFSYVIEYFPTAQLLLFGDGVFKQEMSQLVKNKELTKQIFLKGWVDNIEIPDHQQVIMVMTSRREGLPLCAMEAQKTGIPCITPKTDNFKECISPSTWEYCYSDYSAKGVSESIVSMFNGLKDSKINKNDLVAFSNRFSKNAMIHNFHDAYMKGWKA